MPPIRSINLEDGLEILGTMGNLDRKAMRSGIQVYVELLRNGADILATDKIELASEVITTH